MDGFEGEQPRCPKCGVLMRDIPGGWRCPACGYVYAPMLQQQQLTHFDGPSNTAAEELPVHESAGLSSCPYARSRTSIASFSGLETRRPCRRGRGRAPVDTRGRWRVRALSRTRQVCRRSSDQGSLFALCASAEAGGRWIDSEFTGIRRSCAGFGYRGFRGLNALLATARCPISLRSRRGGSGRRGRRRT